MTTATQISARARRGSTSDADLVRACLQGKEEAWTKLIEKYKRLIYSIPIKYGFSRDDAADIFQAVCLDALAELPRLRQPRALPKWLMEVTAHKCFHWKRRQQRFVGHEEEQLELLADEPGARFEEILAQAEQEQALRDAIAELSPRCQKLIHMLFFETPPRPYQQVAESLGIATGSIGFIRGRCLSRLAQLLEEMGFK